MDITFPGLLTFWDALANHLDATHQTYIHLKALLCFRSLKNYNKNCMKDCNVMQYRQYLVLINVEDTRRGLSGWRGDPDKTVRPTKQGKRYWWTMLRVYNTRTRPVSQQTKRDGFPYPEQGVDCQFCGRNRLEYVRPNKVLWAAADTS